LCNGSDLTVDAARIEAAGRLSFMGSSLGVLSRHGVRMSKLYPRGDALA